MSVYSSIFLSNKEKLKSKKGNGNWTFINVQKRKPEKSFENSTFFAFLMVSVTIIFLELQKL
jgi:hypothetical protein